MTLSKNSEESASAPNLDELLRIQQRQRQLQQESRSTVPANEESGYLSSSGLGSSTSTAASESRSRAPDNEERGNLSSSGLGSSTTAEAPRGSHRSARPVENLRSILRRAVAVLDESDEEPEDSNISSRCDDSNSQP
jgi:hypothetical protein